MSTVIQVDNVSMMFNLSSEKIDNIKEYVIKLLSRKLHFQEFWALRDVSFTLERGDALGIIGLNGSGKSTLLKIISGILKPTKGSVITQGSIAPLIELGAGFDGELTARENIFLNGAILGYDRAYMQKHFDEIVAFAELSDFVDTQVKNFSSGMIARLGFAISTMNVPDILVVDEILSVGDYKFQQKSFARMKNVMDSGATVVFVSHSIDQVWELCNKALWLEHGQVRLFGPAGEVCEQYMQS